MIPVPKQGQSLARVHDACKGFFADGIASVFRMKRVKAIVWQRNVLSGGHGDGAFRLGGQRL